MSAAPKIHEPIYPIAYAAMLAGLDATTAKRWMRGYDFSHNGLRRRSPPVVANHLARPANDQLTFEELLTLRLVRAFRERGLGLPTIKRAAQVAAERYGMANPFVTRAFRTDGRAVFLDLQKQKSVKGEDSILVDALTGQQQFRDVVEPWLFQDVVFVGDLPGQWFPTGMDHAVVIRPDRAFGAPHVQDTGIRTDVLADAVAAEGGDIAAVARWFSLSDDQVRDALAAETKWRHPKAA